MRTEIRSTIKNKSATGLLPFFPHKNNIEILVNFAVLWFKQKVVLTEEQQLAKKAKRKKLVSWLSLGLNVIILAVILIVSLSNQDASTVLTPMIDWRYMSVVIGIVIALILTDTTKIFILIRTSTKKSRPFLSYKTSTLGRYYDAVTPMSSGGQPFQMMYMNKRGVRGDIATGITLVKYIFWQIAYVVICCFALIYNAIHSPGSTNAVATVAAWLVVGVNVLLFTGVILLSVSKKIGPRVVIWALKLLAKMHIVKNYQLTFRKVMKFVINYQNTFKFFASNFIVLISEFVLAFVDIFIYNLIPYFIYKAFLPNGPMLWSDIFIKSIICNLTLSFVPTPGSSGGAEGIFILIFGTSFSKIGQFWPVISWRLATYYFNIVHGFLILIYDFCVGNRKAERLKKEGAEIYNPVAKQSFTHSLNTNLEAIEVVKVQEEDKIPSTLLVRPSVDGDANAPDVIENSDIVSKAEMDKKVQPAVEVLNQVRRKDIQKKRKKIAKKQAKKQNKKWL